MDPTALKLLSLIHKHNRAVTGEALVTLAVGLGTCLVVFGIVFWLAWVAAWFLAGDLGRRATPIAWGVTGLFAILSVFYAWRKADPIGEVRIDPETAARHQLERSLGLYLGVPIFHRESLAGVASLMIGGPANLMDVWPIWRKRIPADAVIVGQAAQLLHQARQGIPAKTAENPRAIAVLYPLGLIKSVIRDGEIDLQATIKAAEILDSSHPAHRTIQSAE